LIVAGITAAAVAAVVFLALQASATASPAGPAKAQPASSASSSTDQPGTSDGRGKTQRPHPLPTSSGSGVRIVYALGEQRVWLVGQGEKVVRTYEVMPSSVSPVPGRYAVTSRSARISGSDGVPVEHVVRFTSVEGVVVGFSAAVDGSTPDPDTEKKTGGIREKRADGNAMWAFATAGTQVVVVA
jgi:hypothetical protein